MPIYLSSHGPADWQALLADPEKHWRTGYSARSVAYSWEAAKGLPPEIDAILGGGTELLLALPEHKVPLPGGNRASQCDVFALARQGDETIAIAVEGKVSEPFGPTVGEWMQDASAGRTTRISAIAELLGLNGTFPGEVRYQLLHRSAAAVLEARRFKTNRAAMVVQSFSPDSMWFNEFERFLALFGLSAAVGELATLTLPGGMLLGLGWAKGDPAFLLA